MAHINKCIEDLLRKSGKKAVEVHAAVWVPDGEAAVCMHCKKTQFTLINRRVIILSVLNLGRAKPCFLKLPILNIIISFLKSCTKFFDLKNN